MFTLLLMTAMLQLGSCPIDLDAAPVQGALITGHVPDGSSLSFQGQDVKIAPGGGFVVGIGRDDVGDIRLDLTVGDTTCSHVAAIVSRDFRVERIDGLPPKTVTPPASWTARRKVENGRVRKARAENTDDLFWQAGFILPASGRFSGFYGSQRILNGKPRTPHYGLDIAAPTGTPVVAPAGGTVRLADPDFLLEGGIVIIDHGFGVTSTLFHLNSVSVAEGAVIAQGDPIGTIGATGRATGPHVDWRINWGNVRVDPGLLIQGEGGDAS